MKQIKSIFALLLALTALLCACGKSDSAAEPEAEGIIVCIVKQSAGELRELALRYSADGETLGSVAASPVAGGPAAQGMSFRFTFPASVLPAGPIGVFRIELFASEKAGENYISCGSAEIREPKAGAVYTLTLNGDFETGLTLSSEDGAVTVTVPERPAPAEEAPEEALSADVLVGPWHLAEDSDLEALSAVFPGAAEFGSGMEIRSDGRISWYIGADGGVGSYVIADGALIADVSGELDGETYRVTLLPSEPDRLTMNFKGAELVWCYGEGETLRGEEG